jgi:hypothetical protein
LGICGSVVVTAFFPKYQKLIRRRR